MNYAEIEKALGLFTPREKFDEECTIGMNVEKLEIKDGTYGDQLTVYGDGITVYKGSQIRRNGKIEFYCPGSLKSNFDRKGIKVGDVIKIVYKGTQEWTPPDKDEPVHVKNFWVEILEEGKEEEKEAW